MPGDLNSSIAYLDVQFGAMDMLDSNSFDNVSDVKFGATNNTNLESTNVASNANLDLSAAAQNTTAIDAYTSAKPNTQSSISSAISQGVSIKYKMFKMFILTFIGINKLRLSLGFIYFKNKYFLQTEDF